MGGELPKVLHKVDGIPMLWRVLSVARSLNPKVVTVVTGGDRSSFSETVSRFPWASFVEQVNRKGTADALAAACCLVDGVPLPKYSDGIYWAGSQERIDGSSDKLWVLVLNGDVPLISPTLVEGFVRESVKQNVCLSVLGVEMPDPTGYGRMVTGPNENLERIVEERDASNQEKTIKLCNSGIILGRATQTLSYLDKIIPSNSQAEYYLTDTVAVAKDLGDPVLAYRAYDHRALRGVNSLEQLESMEKAFKSDTLGSHS